MYTMLRALAARYSKRTRSKTIAKECSRNCQEHDRRIIDDKDRVSALLKTERIPHVFWLEDVLIAFGSDTQVWDLCVLVKDPTHAASVLCKYDYMLSPSSAKFAYDPEFSGRGVCVSPQDSGRTVLLYSEHEWHFHLEADMYGLPALNNFLDSLMDLWLNISLQDYVERLPFALYIASLITYCYNLEDPKNGPVNSKEYASNLQKQHRELHWEIVAADRTKIFASTPRHTYHVRRYWEIKNGNWNPPEGLSKQYALQLSTLDEGSDSVNEAAG